MSGDLRAQMERGQWDAPTWLRAFALDLSNAIATGCEVDPLPLDVKRLREAADALDAMQWRPIETAPVGDRVLVSLPNGEARVARRVEWSTGGYRWRVVPGHYAVEPTHWMPLPAPPDADR